MREALLKVRRFRHVVFPDSVGGYGRAMDLSPRPPLEVAAPPRPPKEPLSHEAELLLRWLFRSAGLDLRDYKPETLGRRLPACLRVLRATSPAHGRSVLQRHPHLARAALDAMLIGVTGFFRDDAVFDVLARRTLPGLLARWTAAGRGRPLRVWSAGCSDGAELYSVAMLLVELGELQPGAVELLGTDCRPGAVARAAGGAYEPAEVRGVPPRLLDRYFAFDGHHYRVHRALRAAAQWRVGDVLAGAEPGPWDLVLCRNLAIYLEPHANAALWASLAASLREGGALVPGKAERPAGAAGLSPDGHCIYHRTATDGAGQ